MRRAFLLFVAACNPYDDDLGPSPFLCGAEEPRCPEGYTCLEENGREVCFDDGSGSSDAKCGNDNAMEPNNTLEMATATPLDTMRNYSIDGLVVCPGIDKDNYAVVLRATNETIDIAVDATVTLRAAILNEAGIPIAAAAPDNGVLKARAQNLPGGTYFVQVAGTGSSLPEHSYRLTIDVAGP